MIREPVLVFDIETVPDIEAGRKILGLDGLSDDSVKAALDSVRLQARGSDFQPTHLHKIVAISVALRRGEGEFKVLSLGEEGAPEAELVRQFFGGIEKYKPTLVSWNGSGFDLPVLHYRSLIHGVPAPVYWETGDNDRDFRYNNYLKRYEWRHTDLMDVLSGFQPRAAAPLTEVAQLLGFPGKLGMDGSKVYEAWRAGRLGEIRAYCETDVLNTYLVYLRFLLVRGQIGPQEHAGEVERTRQFLAQNAAAPHWQEFARAWQ
jgi:predicted PolB exonuclease-like 3'-5' exonuclease